MQTIEMPMVRRLIDPAPTYTKMGALVLPAFTAAMVLDEPTCFIDPGDAKTDSARYVAMPVVRASSGSA